LWIPEKYQYKTRALPGNASFKEAYLACTAYYKYVDELNWQNKLISTRNRSPTRCGEGIRMGKKIVSAKSFMSLYYN
jgi:hypothetical protein